MSTPLRTLVTGRPSPVDEARFADFVGQIWKSGHFTNFGPLETQFAARLRDRMAADEVLLFANGHLALEAMLRGLGAPDGGEIITTPYTFASTVHAIINTGFTPVFVDIEPNGVNIDPDGVQAAITPKTRAILGVHVFGVTCQHERLRAIAESHDVALLYDAAHAFGALEHCRAVPTLGDASILSFHATKIFHSIEGGALVLNSPRVDRELVRGARNFGYTADGVIDTYGSNGKMSELHAAAGLTNIESFDEELAARQRVFNELQQAFANNPYLAALPVGASANGSYFPIFLRGDNDALVQVRPKIVEALKEHGIFTRPYFWPSLTEAPAFRSFSEKGSCPRALNLSYASLCLPIQADFGTEEIERLRNSVTSVCSVLMN